MPCVVVSLASTRLCGRTELCPNCIHFSLLLPDCVLFTCCCFSSASACYHTQSQSRHALVVTHHMRKGSRLSPSLLFIMIVVRGESLGTRLLKEHYWRQLEITRHRGCHSHRLYSHSCEHRSKLREALSVVWQLTTSLTTCLFMELYRKMRSDSTPSLA